MCYLTNWGLSKLHHNSGSLQLTANVCEPSTRLSEDFDRLHPDTSLLIMKSNEYQNMIYVKLRSVDLPATVTYKRNRVAKSLVDDLIKNTKQEKLVV
jgi:hypothetical protein